MQGYRVYRDGSLAATVGTNAFSDTGLAGGSAHTYTVAALDGAGNASAQSTSTAGTATAPVRTTAYTYDLADRLTGITPPAGAGAAATLSLDALGRHRTRTAGGITETYTYAGESSAIVRISPSTGTTTNSVVDATGARLAVSTSSGGFGWTLSDLHGDIAGYAAATGAVVTDATRYDPYGEVLAATSSGLGSPWGYQGRLDLAASTESVMGLPHTRRARPPLCFPSPRVRPGAPHPAISPARGAPSPGPSLRGLRSSEARGPLRAG